MTKLWEPGDTVVWRGIYRNRVWHATPTTVVRDTTRELVLVLTPGVPCMAEVDYAKGKKNGKRRWDFKHEDWKLEHFTWHTNRLLFLMEPDKFYSPVLFWNHETNEFLCYYINFQLPFQRGHSAINTLDLDLDMVNDPDFNYYWKDVDDYERGIESGLILPEWVDKIETAKAEVLAKLENRQYPFHGTWREWMPDPGWSLPTLPENWDKI